MGQARARRRKHSRRAATRQKVADGLPPVVYLAGPFRGRSAWAVESNIRRAERLALQVWRAGAACVCPHTNTRFFDGAAPDRVWLRGDLAILRRCDAVILTRDWRRSTGARAERAAAQAWGIPVFETLAGLRRWIKTQGRKSLT